MQVVIGTRDALTKAEAAYCATMWREATARYPKATFNICVLGYDADPRELWEIPEVRRHVRHWARLAGLDDLNIADFWLGSCRGRLATPPPPDLAAKLTVLALCGVFGEPLRQQALQLQKPAART
jgi:hypothetical protein